MPSPLLPSRWVISSADTTDDPDIFPFLAGRSFYNLKTPVWNTKRDVSVSGRSRGRSLWSYPIWRWSLKHEVLRDSAIYLEQQRLFNFFNEKMGAAGSWFFYDRFDNSVAGMQFGIGDNATATFQLTRTTTIGGVSFTEPVRGLSGSPTIYKNGVATAAFTIGQFGKITFTTPPGTGVVLTWDGGFFFLCHFDADELDTSQIMNGFWQSGSLDFRTFKP